MTAIRKYTVVTISYTIEDMQGEVLERIDLPVSYVQGGIHGPYLEIEQALEGHVTGDTVEVKLGPEQTFGPHDPNLTFTDDIENVPPEYRHLGAEVQFQNEAGDVKTFIVSKIEDGKLTVDGNHPLAGKDLLFRVAVLAVREATPDEIAKGFDQPAGGATLH